MKIRLPRLLRAALLACLITVSTNTLYSASLSSDDAQFTSFVLSDSLDEKAISKKLNSLELDDLSSLSPKLGNVVNGVDLSIAAGVTETVTGVILDIPTLTLAAPVPGTPGGTLDLKGAQVTVQNANGSGVLKLGSQTTEVSGISTTKSSLLTIENSELSKSTIYIAGGSQLNINAVSHRSGAFNINYLEFRDARSKMLVRSGDVVIKQLWMEHSGLLTIENGSLTIVGVGFSDPTTNPTSGYALTDFLGKLSARNGDIILMQDILLLEDRIIADGGSLSLDTTKSLTNQGRLDIGSQSIITADNWNVEGGVQVYQGNVKVNHLYVKTGQLSLYGSVGANKEAGAYTFGSTSIYGVAIMTIDGVARASLGSISGAGKLTLSNGAIVTAGSLNLEGYLDTTGTDKAIRSSLSVQDVALKATVSATYLNLTALGNVTFNGSITKFFETTIIAQSQQISFNGGFTAKTGATFTNTSIEAYRLLWNTSDTSNNIVFGIGNVFKFNETVVTAGYSLSFDASYTIDNKGNSGAANSSTNRSSYGSLGNFEVRGRTNIFLKRAQFNISDARFSSGELRLTDSQISGEGNFVATGTKITLELGDKIDYMKGSSLNMGVNGGFSLTGGSLSLTGTYFSQGESAISLTGSSTSLNANFISLQGDTKVVLDYGSKVIAQSDLSISGNGDVSLSGGSIMTGKTFTFINKGGNLTLKGSGTYIVAMVQGSIAADSTTITLTDGAAIDMTTKGSISLVNGSLSVTSSSLIASSISLGNAASLTLDGTADKQSKIHGDIFLNDKVLGTIFNSTIEGSVIHQSTSLLSFSSTVSITKGLQLASNSKTNIVGSFTIKDDETIGAITLDSGYLTIGSTSTEIQTTVFANIDVLQGTLELANITFLVGQISMSGGVSDSRVLLVSKTIADIDLTVAAQSVLQLGEGVAFTLTSLSGSGDINLTGGGILTLARANSYSGDINWSGSTSF